jgi:hypothetical protein
MWEPWRFRTLWAFTASDRYSLNFTQTYRQHGDSISLLSFSAYLHKVGLFRNEERRLKWIREYYILTSIHLCSGLSFTLLCLGDAGFEQTVAMLNSVWSDVWRSPYWVWIFNENVGCKYRTGGALTLIDTLSEKKRASKELWSFWDKSGPTAEFSFRTRLLWIYSIHYGNDGASSSVMTLAVTSSPESY